MQDILGQRIFVGNYVAVAKMDCKAARLIVGRVTKTAPASIEVTTIYNSSILGNDQHKTLVKQSKVWSHQRILKLDNYAITTIERGDFQVKW